MFPKILNRLKIVYLSIANKLPILLSKIFTKANSNKMIIIFIVGFISRVLIVNFYNVNVYFEYTNIISIMYYSSMSFFIVIVHEFVNYFEFNIIPSYILELYPFFVNAYKYIINFASFLCKTINSANRVIFYLKLADFKVSSIRRNFILDLNKEKMTMGINIDDNKENIEKMEDILNNNVLQKNNLKSSRGRKIPSRTTENVRLPANYPNPGVSPRGNDGLLFGIESLRDSTVGQPEQPLRSTESVASVSTPPSPTPTMPHAPNLNASNLSTPSISTIKTTDTPRFNSLTSSSHENNHQQTNVEKSYPIVSRVIYSAPVNGSQATYSTVNPGYISMDNNFQYYPNNHGYIVPGEVPYFNVASGSYYSDKATLGSIDPNERLGLNYSSAPGPSN
jgi:hypothetical protein